MTTYIIRRLLWLVPVLFFVALITFLLMHSAPGGPWDRDPVHGRWMRLRRNPSTSALVWTSHSLSILRAATRLTASSLIMCSALHGDLGPSYRQRGVDVQDILFKPPKNKPIWESRFGYSPRLGLLAMGLAVVFGIPLGIVAALRRNSGSIIRPCLYQRWVFRCPVLCWRFSSSLFWRRKLKFEDHPKGLVQPDGVADAGRNPGFWYLCHHHAPDAVVDAGSHEPGLCAHSARQGTGATPDHFAAYVAQRADPGGHDPGAGAGGAGDRCVHH